MFKIVERRLRSILVDHSTLSKTYFTTNSTPKPVHDSFDLAVKEAEKIVGYPTSFLNLHWLLNDDITRNALHIKKLVRVEHPLIDTAKRLLIMNYVPTWELVILLVAKCARLHNVPNAVDIDDATGILHSQRTLAGVAEMIRTAILVHQGILNHKASNVCRANKLALLCGDYILSKCFNDLANIKNHDVNNLISSILRDLTENEFLGERDSQNFPLPAKPLAVQEEKTDLINTRHLGPYQMKDILGHSKSEWYLRSILGGANLLGKSCQAVCILTKQNDKVQESAFLLGKYIGLAWQIKIDVEMFEQRNFGNYFLVSAPVMWCLSNHPELHDEIAKGSVNINDCNFDRIHDFVNHTNAIEKCRSAQDDLIRGSFQFLSAFEKSTAKQSLQNLLESLICDFS